MLKFFRKKPSIQCALTREFTAASESTGLLFGNRSLHGKMKRLYDETRSLIANTSVAKPSNAHFGVGPILQPNSATERQMRMQEFDFQSFVERTYGLSVGTQHQIMHRTPTGLKATHDYLQHFYNFIGKPKGVRIGLVSGSGYGGFGCMCANILDPSEKVYVDTPDPRKVAPGAVGAFRHRWARDLVSRYENAGFGSNIVFATTSGSIPSPQFLTDNGVKFIVGVGNETSFCSKYNEQDMKNLYDWVDLDKSNHHAIVDSTSLIGAMDMSFEHINFFSPPQKAAAGVPGIAILGIRSETASYIEQANPKWHIEAVFDFAPTDPKTGKRSIASGPFYNPETGLTGPVINTNNIIGLMRSSFSLKNVEKEIGGKNKVLVQRSEANLAALSAALSTSSLLSFGHLDDNSRRSTATALVNVSENDLTFEQRKRAIILSKDFLGTKGIKRPNGEFIPGLNIADNLDIYPGTPGDYRFWIAGLRPAKDMGKLIQSIEHAYWVGRCVVIEECLTEAGINISGDIFPSSQTASHDDDEVIAPRNLSKEAIKILCVDPIGLLPLPGQPEGSSATDVSEAKAYIESKGWIFSHGPVPERDDITQPGIYFSYQPDLTPEEISQQTRQGQYDAIIAAAKVVPEDAVLPEGGVRMGAGVNNMQSRSFSEGSPLMNTPGQNSSTTAEVLFQALLDSRMNLVDAHNEVMQDKADSLNIGKYAKSGLRGQRIAIIGVTGNIGHEVCKLAKAHGMEVVGWGRSFTPLQAAQMGIKHAKTIAECAKEADVVTVHVALNDATNGIIGRDVLSAMKKDGTVVNFGRGPLVDKEAVEHFLTSNPQAKLITDADIFVDGPSTTSGPLKPFVEVAQNVSSGFGDQLRVINLPHIAADCDHPTRVRALQQAVDQLHASITQRIVENYAGSGPIPTGFINAGQKKPDGVGPLNHKQFQAIVASNGALIATHAKAIYAILGDGNAPNAKALSKEDRQDLHLALCQLAQLASNGRALQ